MDDEQGPMQYASGYQLDLYCDTCYGELNSAPSVFVGETFTDCARQAARRGWTIRTGPRTARCPDCKKKPNAR